MFQFLDHPSDAYVEVTAISVEEVFQDAATALFEIMTDTISFIPEEDFQIRVESPDRSLLLIDWLNRLVLLHELEKVFLCSFRVKIQQTKNWKLTAVVTGERIKEKHEKRSQVKSVTLGLFEWNEEANGHRVRFLVDI